MRGEDFRGKATGVIDLSKAGDKVALTSVMGSQGASPTFLWRWEQLWPWNVFTPFKHLLSPVEEVKRAL